MYFRKLQVLRGLAALAVVLDHVHEYLLILSGKPDTYFRFFGVQFSMGTWFFFVLSGFLMSYLIDTGSDRFLIRRLVRIYPTYWLAVLSSELFGTVSSGLFGTLHALFQQIDGSSRQGQMGTRGPFSGILGQRPIISVMSFHAQT